MKFTLTIDLGNDAMRTRAHLRRALRDCAVAIRDVRDEGKILDVNGNAVGEWAIGEGDIARVEIAEAIDRRARHMLRDSVTAAQGRALEDAARFVRSGEWGIR